MTSNDATTSTTKQHTVKLCACGHPHRADRRCAAKTISGPPSIGNYGLSSEAPQHPGRVVTSCNCTRWRDDR